MNQTNYLLLLDPTPAPEVTIFAIDFITSPTHCPVDIIQTLSQPYAVPCCAIQGGQPSSQHFFNYSQSFADIYSILYIHRVKTIEI